MAEDKFKKEEKKDNGPTRAEYNDLLRRIKAVEDWMKMKKLQQISLPLDEPSKKIISEI